MIFPFSVHFSRRLKATITADNQEEILQYITKSISESKANNVVTQEMWVKYKGSTSYSRGALFGSVDDGIFNLIYKDNSWWLNYQINMRKLFIGTATLSIIMGTFALVNRGPWWIGIASFLWLCGANWITILIRHGIVATNISAGINELICGKEPEPENTETDERLKSWF